jgi:hypothetical protein
MEEELPAPKIVDAFGRFVFEPLGHGIRLAVTVRCRSWQAFAPEPT